MTVLAQGTAYWVVDLGPTTSLPFEGSSAYLYQDPGQPKGAASAASGHGMAAVTASETRRRSHHQQPAKF